MGCSHTYPALSTSPITTWVVAEDAPTYSTRTPASRREGDVLRLAMSLIEGVRSVSSDRDATRSRLKRFCSKAVSKNASGNEEVSADAQLGPRLMALARQSDRHLSEQLELLVRYADTELFKSEGCRTMVQWMDIYLGLGRIAASEHLRVGRALRDLPMCGALFALGKLSYTKARIITRHATPDTDEAFATGTLDLSSSETRAWCEHYRHEQDATAIAAAVDSAALASLIAYEKRALRTREISRDTTRITLDLPHDMAAEFLRSLEQCDDEVLNQVRDGASEDAESPTAVQRRADAAVLMSRRSLAHAGEAVSMADRFRVHVMVDANTLSDKQVAASRKPLMDGRTPVSTAAVRRLAELAGFTAYAVDQEGDPVASKHMAAPFSRRQLRALRARDGCCQMPGCGATRHLDGHHVVPRSEGGRSTLDNAVLLCSGCHRLLHEGGYRLERRSITADSTPEDRIRRYRLFGADGVECRNRRVAVQRTRAEPSNAERTKAANVFPQGNMSRKTEPVFEHSLKAAYRPATDTLQL